MRRAIAAAAVGGLVLGGVMAIPAFAATAAKTTDQTIISTTGKKTAMKTVVYHGYEFQVPASWPVYRLDQHPTTCVRYDVHAVYLGTPGANMQCPAGLVGRTQTVSVIPSTTVASGSGSADRRPAPAARQHRRTPRWAPCPRCAARSPRTRPTTSCGSRSARRRSAPPSSRPTAPIPQSCEQVLGTLRAAPARAAQTRSRARRRRYRSRRASARPPSSASAAVSHAAALARDATAQPDGAGKTAPPRATKSPKKAKSAKKVKATIYKSWRGVPANWPTQIVVPQPPPPPFKIHPVSGFDACTAPTLATMKVWRQQYAAIGVYIGGANSACAYGNLSTAWFKSAAAMGWGMLPTYVGPQAPCWGYQGTLINPGKAAAEGRAAGADAVKDAKLFGLPVGLADLRRHGGLRRRPGLHQRGSHVPRRVGPGRWRPRAI